MNSFLVHFASGNGSLGVGGFFFVWPAAWSAFSPALYVGGHRIFAVKLLQGCWRRIAIVLLPSSTVGGGWCVSCLGKLIEKYRKKKSHCWRQFATDAENGIYFWIFIFYHILLLQPGMVHFREYAFIQSCKRSYDVLNFKCCKWKLILRVLLIKLMCFIYRQSAS